MLLVVIVTVAVLTPVFVLMLACLFVTCLVIVIITAVTDISISPGYSMIFLFWFSF